MYMLECADVLILQPFKFAADMKSDTVPLVGENNGPADSPTLTVTGTYNGPPDCGLTQTSPWLVGVNRAPFSDQTYKVMITPQGFDTWPQEFRWRVSCESSIPREYSHDGTEQKGRCYYAKPPICKNELNTNPAGGGEVRRASCRA